jgi:membrane fusion protein
LRAQAPGAVVQGGDTLCELACSGQNLQAELKVPEQGMARMKEGQGVKLLYDAFPYQRFGVRFGVVRWISPAAISGETSGGFRVLVDPKDSFVYVKGIRRPLMPGMAGSAEIVLERRSLISYAFAPIRQLQESLSSPPDEGNKK